MFDRFTDNARKAMGFARQESQRFNHDYIGAEHVLLGLIHAGGPATHVLKNLDVDSREIRREIEKLLVHGTEMVTMGQIPFTPGAKKALELSLEEANSLGHNYIDTEHLLLGLVRLREGPTSEVLQHLSIRLEDVREEVFELLGAEIEGDPVSEVSLGPASPFFIVADVPRAVAFYEEKLGFEVRYTAPDDGAPFFAVVRRNAAQILLKAVSDDVGPQPNHTRHGWAPWDAFVLVYEPDALAAEFAERGVTFHEELGDRDDGLRGCAVCDLDGYVLFFGCVT